LITFSLVCFAWIFFKANNLSDALYIVSHFFTGWKGFGLFSGPLQPKFVIGAASIGILLSVHLLQGESGFVQWLSKKRAGLRWAVYYSMIVAILLFGHFESREFIYFQF
jgi:hypothetical protein